MLVRACVRACLCACTLAVKYIARSVCEVGAGRVIGGGIGSGEEGWVEWGWGGVGGRNSSSGCALTRVWGPGRSRRGQGGRCRVGYTAR